MATLPYIDINAAVGLPTKRIAAPIADMVALDAAYGPHPPVKILLWHVLQRDTSAMTGNTAMAQFLADDSTGRCLGSVAVLPPMTNEVIDPADLDGFFDAMKRSNTMAVRAFPASHHYLLEPVVFGEVFAQLIARHIPLFLSSEHGTSWEAIYRLLEHFPALPCVICDIGIWGMNRMTWPLLKAYPNVYIESSLLHLAHEGLESTVNTFGADRIVFGTGLPWKSAQAALLALLHADICDADKERIAWKNAADLLEVTL